MNRLEGKTNLELSKSLLAKNTVYNLLGQIIPMIVGLITIPILMNNLGIERFGLLSIVWMVVGYFSLFDLGIGRATTKFVAECLALGDTKNLNDIIWTSIIMLSILGIIGAIVLVLLTPWLVSILKIAPDLTEEIKKAFYWLALSVPFIICASGTRGILEAKQEFRLVNLITIPASIAIFLLPVMVLPFSINLVPITMILVFSRLTVSVIYLVYCLKALPGLNRPPSLSLSTYKRLLSYGGWLTVSNIIGPFMAYLDRFIVGGVISIQAVAYYSTSYDLITKLWVIPTSIMGVMFSAFSFYSTQPDKLIPLFQRTISYILVSLSPILFAVILFAEPFLNLWLGYEFAEHSTRVLQILALAVMINSLSQVPYALIQSNNRPDITAILHIIELPVYFTLIWFLIKSNGIIGVAMAFLIRIVVDTFLLYWIANQMLKKKPFRETTLLHSLSLALGIMVLLVPLSTMLTNNIYKLILYVFIFLFYLFYFSKAVLKDNERQMIMKTYYYLKGRI